MAPSHCNGAGWMRDQKHRRSRTRAKIIRFPSPKLLDSHMVGGKKWKSTAFFSNLVGLVTRELHEFERVHLPDLAADLGRNDTRSQLFQLHLVTYLQRRCQNGGKTAIANFKSDGRDHLALGRMNRDCAREPIPLKPSPVDARLW